MFVDAEDETGGTEDGRFIFMVAEVQMIPKYCVCQVVKDSFGIPLTTM